MLLEWWSGTDCTLYTDQATVDKFGKEHVIIILNHNYEIDFLCGWTMCERYGILGVSNIAKTLLTLHLLFRMSSVHIITNLASLPRLYKTVICPSHTEFKSVGQTRAAESPSDWLDLVLPRNSFLQKKVGGGPKHCLQRTGQTQGLP